jgi:L,D-transpeptidase catalytic domain
MTFTTKKTAILLISFSPLFFVGCSKPAVADQATSAQSGTLSQEVQAVVNDPTALAEFNHLDPQRLVPDKALKQALTYFKAYKKSFPNKGTIAIIDYTKHSARDRLFLIDMNSGKVETYQTSHGKGSDPSNTGYAKQFSNVGQSKMSSVGFYRTASTYTGSHGRSLLLDGLSSTNSNARARAIVMHPATYVNESSKTTGRSWGCPAVDPKYSNHIIDKLKNGALIYGWNGK